MSKTNLQFTGPQKGLTTVGKFAYAYSGNVTTASSTATILEFTTGKEYLDCILKMCITDQTVSSVNYSFTMTFNGQIVVKEFLTNPYAGRQPSDHDNWYIIIPPLTAVKLDFLTTSGEKTAMAVLRGEVIG